MENICRQVCTIPQQVVQMGLLNPLRVLYMPMLSAVYHQLAPDELNRSKALGARMRIARQRRNWAQQALSKKVGISVGMLKKMESGNPRVPLAFWIKIMDVFGVKHEIDLLLQPQNDLIGAGTEMLNARLRVRQRSSQHNDFEFPS